MSTATTMSDKTRKKMRVDLNGDRMVRMTLVITKDEERTILKAIAKKTGERFNDEYVFGNVDKEEFRGSAIAKICAQ